MIFRMFLLATAVALGSPAFPNSSNCSLQTDDLQHAREDLERIKHEYESVEEHGLADLTEYDGKSKAAERRISYASATLRQCVQAELRDELFKKNTDSIQSQAEKFKAQIREQSEQQIAIENARGGLYRSMASLSETKTKLARRTQEDAERMRDRYVAVAGALGETQPAVSEDEKIAELQQRADDQIGSVMGALRAAAGTPAQLRGNGWAPSTASDRASRSTEKRSFEVLDDPKRRAGVTELAKDVGKGLAKNASETQAGPDPGRSVPPSDDAPQAEPSNGTSSSCADDMEFLHARIKSPELKAAPLISVNAMIQRAGDIRRATLLLRGQADANREALEVHLANRKLRENFPDQYRRFEQALRDMDMVNKAYLEACECRLVRVQR